MVRKKQGLHPNEPLKHADHRRPITRREFVQQGFISGGAMAMGPTLLGLFSNPAEAALSSDIQSLLDDVDICGGVNSSTKIPFICFDLAGGANIAGSNVLIGKQGGQQDFLSTAGYSKLGVPGDMLPGMSQADPLVPNGFVNEQLGLAFHSDSGFLKGIMDSISLTTAANINGAVIPARSDNDTANNPHNPMYGIVKAGQKGELLNLVGSRSSISGGNSVAPMSLIDPENRPTKIDSPNDTTGLVDTGKLVGLFEADESVYVMEAIQRLSDKKLKNVDTKLTNDAVIKEMVSCGYVKSADLVDRYGDPATLDPELDGEITDVNIGNTGYVAPISGEPPIFPTLEWNGTDRNEFRKTASIMKLVINGYAGAGTITMGGFDYHTGDRITGELRDYRAGRCMGACLEYAARKNKKLMLYVCSDGSVSSNGSIDTSTDVNGIYNGNKGEWTSDNSGTAASFFLVYDPAGSPTPLTQQIGYFDSNANVVTSSSPCANNVNLLVNTVLLNYMTLNGDRAGFTAAFPGHGLGNSDSLDALTAFNAL